MKIKYNKPLTKIQVAIIVVVIVIALFIGVYYSLSRPPAVAKEIVIGSPLALTGKFAKDGKFYKDGWELAVEEINEKGGILGAKIKLIVEDDRSDPAYSATVMEKLINEYKIVATLGAFPTACTEPTSAIAEKYKIPYVGSGSATWGLYERGFKYYFQIFPPTSRYIPPIISLYKSLSPRPESIAITYELTAWGEELKNILLKEAEKEGFKVVFCEGYAAGTADFTPLLLKIKALNPDAYIDIGHTTDEILLCRQSAEIGFNPKIWHGMLTATLDFSQSLGKLAENILGTPAWHETAKFPGNEEFVKKYKEKYKVEQVDYHAALAYASVYVLAEAIKIAGEINPEKIRDALTKVDIMTIVGRVKFDEKGCNVYSRLLITQIQNGQIMVVWPKEAAAVNIIYPKPPFKS